MYIRNNSETFFFKTRSYYLEIIMNSLLILRTVYSVWCCFDWSVSITVLNDVDLDLFGFAV